MVSGFKRNLAGLREVVEVDPAMIWVLASIRVVLQIPSPSMRAFKALRVSVGRLIDVLPDLGDHNGAFAHCRGHPLDRPGAYVADSKNAGVGCRERRSR